jgi:predicted site-specific integrase-resolvase
MNLASWAERNGVARVSAFRWFRAGVLSIPAQRVGGLILVHDRADVTRSRGRTAVYARVSSADQKSDLDRQVARVLLAPEAVSWWWSIRPRLMRIWCGM